jgi:hypothetical protein
MKKLNWILFIAVALVTSVAFVSCEKDTLSEEEALKLQSQLEVDKYTANKVTDYLIDYSVVLVDATTSTILKSAEGTSTFGSAVITVAQGDSTWTENIKDANDMAYFTGLKFGTASVNIAMTGYSEVNYVISLTQSNLSSIYQLYDNYDFEIPRFQVANLIPMLPVSSNSATISGTVTFDNDLTNTVPEVVANTPVLAMVRTNSAALTSFSGNNLIQDLSYGELSMATTTDANGQYSISVPAAVNGLTYDMIVPKFQTSQTIFDMWTTDTIYSAKTVQTVFGFGSGNGVNASGVPTVSPVALVKFSDPDYTYTPAQISFVVEDRNQIGLVQVVDNGDGEYIKSRPSMTYTLINPNTVTGNGSDATLTLTTNDDGRVTKAVVSNAGDNFPANYITADRYIEYVEDENYAVLEVSGVNGTGGITGLSIQNAGTFLTADMASYNVTPLTVSGAGASITITGLSGTGSTRSVSALNVGTAGSGYAVGNEFRVGISKLDATKAQIRLKFKGGHISAVSV